MKEENQKEKSDVQPVFYPESDDTNSGQGQIGNKEPFTVDQPKTKKNMTNGGDLRLKMKLPWQEQNADVFNEDVQVAYKNSDLEFTRSVQKVKKDPESQIAGSSVPGQLTIEDISEPDITPVSLEKEELSVQEIKPDLTSLQESTTDDILPEKKEISEAEATAVIDKKKKSPGKRLITLGMVFLSGIISGGIPTGFITYDWYDKNNLFRDKYTNLSHESEQIINDLQSKNKALEKKLEDREFELGNVSIGYNQISKILERSSLPPEKPRYMDAKDGIMVYWTEDVLWRRYHVYRASGPKGPMVRQTKKPQKNNFMIEKNKKGVWRYAISAIDREGNETEMSPEVTVVIK